MLSFILFYLYSMCVLIILLLCRGRHSLKGGICSRVDTYTLTYMSIFYLYILNTYSLVPEIGLYLCISCIYVSTRTKVITTNTDIQFDV